MRGPLTVFAGGEYAGDSVTGLVTPGAESLITYARDVEVDISPIETREVRQITKLKLTQGLLMRTYETVRTLGYSIKNRTPEPRRVVIEQPIEADWQLAEPKRPDEQTHVYQRFVVMAKPGEPATLPLRYRNEVVTYLGLKDVPTIELKEFADSKVASPALVGLLRELFAARNQLAEKNNELADLRQQLAVAKENAIRMRTTLTSVERSSQDLMQRFERKLSAAEDQIEKLESQIAEVNNEIIGLFQRVEHLNKTQSVDENAPLPKA